MESWESDILIRRRYDLINKTDCTPNLIAKLVEKKVLSKDDRSSLTVKRNLEGQEAQSDALYTTVEKKVNGFRILIGALIQVDQLAPAKILIEEANKLGKGNGLPQLPPEADELSSSTTDAACTQPEPVWLPKDMKNFVENELELDVHSAPPDANDMYSLPPKGRGYAFILNIIEISGQEPRLGAKEDTKYMIKLLKGLGYKIFPDKYTLYTRSNWNKEQIITELEKFKTKCIRDRVDSIVVYAGSHGYENTILTATKY
ncbi:Caspase-2 [Orchesella cincta]|uniref:Caspase-2 n=1 Tax=Orchesella cincta TaxID=48709 RepID=A0A1D2M2M7_ORCCI|nr:Caspase-2 [Orchesella cincta]